MKPSAEVTGSHHRVQSNRDFSVSSLLISQQLWLLASSLLALLYLIGLLGSSAGSFFLPNLSSSPSSLTTWVFSFSPMTFSSIYTLIFPKFIDPALISPRNSGISYQLDVFLGCVCNRHLKLDMLNYFKPALPPVFLTLVNGTPWSGQTFWS